MTSRRSFLKGVLALTVASIAAPAIAALNVPTIYGDGVHDDWAGLQALFDGKPFRVDGETVIAREGLITKGDFLLSRTLYVREGVFYVGSCGLTAMPGFEGDYLLWVDAPDCYFDLLSVDTRNMTKSGAMLITHDTHVGFYYHLAAPDHSLYFEGVSELG